MHLKKNICPFMKHMLILTVNVAVYALVCKLCTHGPYGLLYFEIKHVLHKSYYALSQLHYALHKLGYMMGHLHCVLY